MPRIWYPIECCHGYDHCPICDSERGCPICDPSMYRAEAVMTIKRQFDRPGTGVAPRPLDKVEKELVLADIAFLKQKAIDDGSMEKWKKDQKPWEKFFRVTETFIQPSSRPTLRPMPAPHVTEEYFRYAMKRAPTIEELIQCNCDIAGEPGHLNCGWCIPCDKPKFVCYHRRR
jgi:hypothetical protein